jgi:hypothetical protein
LIYLLKKKGSIRKKVLLIDLLGLVYSIVKFFGAGK